MSNPADEKKEDTKWTSSDEATLVETLRKAQDIGLQADSGWKPVVWTMAEQALAGSELKSGGAPKVEKTIKSRWQRVSSFVYSQLKSTD